MAITYNAGTDTITVTAGTPGVPNTFTDIYNADVAGAWGQVTKTGNMFVFSAKLQVGDGSTATYLHDTFKKVTLNEIWTVKNNAELKTGLQIGGHPRKGCFLVLNTTAATAINVESGGTFYRYQSPSENTGTGVNAITGATEDFYRGVQIIDLVVGNSNHIGIGLTEDPSLGKVLESACPYAPNFWQIARWNPTTMGWQSSLLIGCVFAAGDFSTVEPSVAIGLIVTTACTLIIDTVDDGERYATIWAGFSGKFRFDMPAGGGGLMRNPPMTGGMV
jgi:hypothetical protein